MMSKTLVPNRLSAGRTRADIHGRFLSVLLAVALVLPGGLARPESVMASVATTRISVGTGAPGAEGDADSRAPFMTPDGRYVVFESRATNLVAGDTNGYQDIFVRDTTTNVTERVSVSSAGVEANGSSWNASISSDGRYVAFESLASNLVAGDTNSVRDVFVRDRQTGATTRVSVATGTPGVEANAASQNPMISADGRFVAFDSSATNLVSGDSNKMNDVFVRNLETNTTVRVSLTNTGAQALYGGSSNPSISADGRYVAFESSARNLVTNDTNLKRDIFVRDRTNGTTTRVSVSAGSAEANSDSYDPAISGNGLVVAFKSYATNLVSGDTNGVADVFVRVWSGSTTTQRVSVGAGGVQANGSSSSPSISSTGRYVAFDSDATNLVASDTNGFDDVFVRDRTAGTTTRVSIPAGGGQGNGHSREGFLSSNGMTVALQSAASNMVAGDTNGSLDVFVNIRGPLATVSDVVSTTHPSSTTWYASGEPRFEWTGSNNGGGLAGYSVSLSPDSAVEPDDVVDTTDPFWVSPPVSSSGVWYFKVKALNDFGNWGPVAGPVTVRIDVTKPTGVLTVDGGAAYTNTRTVTAASSVVWGPSGPHSTGAMRFSTDGGGTWGSWLAFDANHPLTLPAGDGAKTVLAEYRDAVGNISVSPATDSIVLDETPPEGTIVLGGGAEYTGTSTVSVTSQADFGPSGPDAAGAMRFSTDGGASWGSWEQFAAESQVTLPAGDGVKEVRALFRDGAGNVSAEPATATIVLDATAPVITSLTSSSHGAAGSWSADRDVAVAWDAESASGIEGYAWTWSQDAGVSPGFEVETTDDSAGFDDQADGTWYFKVRAKNMTGVWGSTAALTVRVDATPPTGTILLDGGATTTDDRKVTVDSSGVSFGPSGPDPAGAMRFSVDDGSEWTGWLTYSSSYQVTLPPGDGEKTVLAVYRDAAGNVTDAPISATITLQEIGFGPVLAVEGANRFATAVKASQVAYPHWLDPGGARTVVIATGRNWPDALGGSALAGVLDGPILLVDRNSVPAVVLDEIRRLEAQKAIILGGEFAVGAAVESALKSELGTTSVTRIAGGSRYQTADAIAKRVIELGGVTYDGMAFVATGANFPDALAAAPLAAAQGWPIFLANPRSGLLDETRAAMADVTDVAILGGEVVVSPSVETYLRNTYGTGNVQRVGGTSRYATASMVAAFGVSDADLVWNRVGIATGENFPDALAGGVLQGKAGSVMLLTRRASLHDATRVALTENATDISTVTFFGGVGAVSDDVRAAVDDALGR